MLIRSVRLALVLCVLAPVTAARAASIWTPVNTGLPTSDTITGISWPSASEVVAVTGGGRIVHGPLSALTAATVSPANPTGFTDVSMSPDGTKGVAVGGSGQIYRTINSGGLWTPVTGTKTTSDTECHASPDFTPPTVVDVTENLFSVRFADNSTVYITGAHADVLKSTNGGASFTEANKKADGTCFLTGLGGDITGQQWVDATHGFLISNDFGEYYTTVNGLASVTKQTGSVNLGRARVAIDPGTPTHAWAISDGAANGSYFQYTTDNGGSWNTPDFDRNQVSLQDIAAAGSTVVAAGKGGDIYTSGNGRTFFRQVAAPPLATNDWFAAAMLGGSNSALVGGTGGSLVTTTKANAIPDTTAPTGNITGPTTRAPKQFGTYTAHVTDNAGGSGVDPSSYVWSTPGLPNQTGKATATFAFSTKGNHTISVTFKDLAGNTNSASITVTVALASGVGTSGGTTTTTGGTTIVIWKKVTISGHKGRYIPVKLSTKKPRRFVVSLQANNKRHRTLAKLTTTLRKGKKTVKLGVPRKLKAGNYRLVVQVFTTGKHGHRTGRTVKQVFVLV